MRNGFKDCPWQTGNDVHSLMTLKDKGWWQVHCLTCGSRGPARKSESAALNNWNKREEAQ